MRPTLTSDLLTKRTWLWRDGLCIEEERERLISESSSQAESDSQAVRHDFQLKLGRKSSDLPTLLFGRGPVRTFFQSSSSVTYVDNNTHAKL